MPRQKRVTQPVAREYEESVKVVKVCDIASRIWTFMQEKRRAEKLGPFLHEPAFNSEKEVEVRVRIRNKEKNEDVEMEQPPERWGFGPEDTFTGRTNRRKDMVDDYEDQFGT